MGSFPLILFVLGAIIFAHHAVHGTDKIPPPVVIWYGPFLSGGGYCSEAHSYAAAIVAALQSAATDLSVDATITEPNDSSSLSSLISGTSENRGRAIPTEPFTLLLTQHGDSLNPSFIRDIPDFMQTLLKENWIEERDFYWRLRHKEVALAICHSEPGAWEPAHYRTSVCPPAAARYKVGRTMFETNRVPNGWAERMNKMDEIWVPTRFQEKVFAEGGVHPEKIKFVPEAVDVHFFDPGKVETPYDLAREVAFELSASTTVYLSIFKWEERKAWRVLLKAYFEAFRREDDVVLVLLTNAYHIESETAKDFMSLIEEFTLETVGKPLVDLPYIHILPPHVPQDSLPSLYKAANAFVLPSRGEGWGRPHVEAMAMELPVIATFWSGTTEYMTEANSYPLNIDGLVEITEGAFRGHKWANPSVEHLKKLLRRIKEHPEEAIAKGKQARKDMLSKYSPEVIGDLLVEHIMRILAYVERKDVEEAVRKEAGEHREEL